MDNLLTFADEANLDEAQEQFRELLISSDWLLDSPGLGLNPLGSDAVKVIAGLLTAIDALGLSLHAEGGLRSLHFPPVSPRNLLEKTDYAASFPQLLAVLSTFSGSSKEHAALLAAHARGGNWYEDLSHSDFALVPAVCHPLYDYLSGSHANGTCYELTGYCFRNEPSPDPMRRVSFRMREYVVVGTEAQALVHRKLWLENAAGLLSELGLEVSTEVANDPFFGRAGKMLSNGQRHAALKFELLTEVYPGHPTAIASGNCHQSHFGDKFNISSPEGVAHSSCFGFGIERIMLALVARHGLILANWPVPVLAKLGLP